MNPWQMVWTITGWIVLVVVVLILVMLALSILLWVAQAIKKRFPAKKLSSENYYREANRIATEGYAYDTLLAPDLIRAFNAGAHWGRELSGSKKRG